jgi:hypothetical protein
MRATAVICDLLTGSATWLAPLGLTRLAGMPASVVLDKLPASEQAAARGLAMQSKNYRALYTEYMGIDPALAVARSLPPVPAVPTVVLSTNALSEFPPGWELDYMRQHWIAGQRALARETCRQACGRRRCGALPATGAPGAGDCGGAGGAAKGSTLTSPMVSK